MGYPVAYRTSAARAGSRGRAPASKVPQAANDNFRPSQPPQPANDNYPLPGRTSWPRVPTPANDNAPLKGPSPGVAVQEAGQLRRVQALLRNFDPVEAVLWSGARNLLNMVPGFARDIPRDQWGLMNNYKQSLPLAKRWDNRSEVYAATETAASLSTRLTGQAVPIPFPRAQTVGAGAYLSMYHVYWVGSPLFTWRADETADYGPASATMTARNFVGATDVPLGMPRLGEVPIPHVLLPYRRPSPWPQEWDGGYQTPSRPTPATQPATSPVPRPRPQPQTQPVPKPRPQPGQPPVVTRPLPDNPPLVDPTLPWPPVVPRPQPGTDPTPQPPVVVSPTTPPLTPRRPPGPGVKERKTRAQKALLGLIGVWDALSEYGDVMDAFYDALPENRKKKGASPLEKSQALYRFWGEVDLDTAIYNAVFSQVSDFVWAQLGVKGHGRYGGASGANKILNKAYGKDVGAAIKAVDGHVKAILNAAMGLTIK